MIKKVFRLLSTYPCCTFRLQYKSLSRIQNFKFCFSSKSIFNANFCYNVRSQSSTTNVQPIEAVKESEKMIKFTFVTYKGEEIEMEAECGQNIMALGVKSEVFSDGTCGGVLECTICHVYVEDKIANSFSKQSKREEDKLDATKYLQPNSRLSCQLYVTENIEGARFHLPKPTKSLLQDEYPT